MQTQISCPRCQTPFVADIHQVIDVGQNPRLKFELLNGNINTFVCPNCGMSGQMATPILYHDPEHELFMVYVPMELNLEHEEQQRLIGQLVQAVMDQTPPDQRRGYMLQPKEIISYQTFLEKILETEGVTPDMLERQRKQAELLQTMVGADRDVIDTLLQERADEIDETFFAMLRSNMEMAQQRNDEEQVLRLTNLQARLYTETEVGRRLEARQTALRSFQREVQAADNLTPEVLLKHVLRNRNDEHTVDALLAVGQPAFNYEFFRLLTEKIESAAKAHDKDTAKELTTLRSRLLDRQKEMEQQSQEILNRAMGTLQNILDAEDLEEAVQANLAQIDDAFMYVLSAMIAQAERQGKAEQAQSLQRVQDLIVEEAEKQVPPEIRLINRLLQAEDEQKQRQILDDNPDMLTPNLVQMLEALVDQIESEDQSGEVADEINRLKAMVAARV